MYKFSNTYAQPFSEKASFDKHVGLPTDIELQYITKVHKKDRQKLQKFELQLHLAKTFF